MLISSKRVEKELQDASKHFKTFLRDMKVSECSVVCSCNGTQAR